MNNKIRYSCSGYIYAPESFKCYMIVINANNHNHCYYELTNFTKEENSKVAMVYISSGREKAEAEIKKIIRKKQEFHNNITYGYKFLNENKIAYLEYIEIDNDANIQRKLMIYKEVKQYFKNKNYIVTDFVLDSFSLDGHYKSLGYERKEVKKTLDSRPIKIKFLKKRDSL